MTDQKIIYAFIFPYPRIPSPPASGGLGTSIKNLAEQLVKRDIDITVFVYGQKKNMNFEENGISFHFIIQLQYNFFGWYLYRKYLESYLNKVILEENIDVVEAPDWTGITAFMKLKSPHVIRMNGSDSYFCSLEGRPQKKKNFWFEKLALQGADRLLSVSEFTANKTREIFKLKKEITVIPNSVDVNVFSPTGEEVEADSILYFGSIIRKKGVLDLAKIFKLINKENPNVHLIMAGRDVPDIQTGKSTRALVEEILNEEARKNISWLGSLPYEKIKSQISKAAVIVLPSFAEALPMTWLEAMAMEKALVTSDIGWAKEVMVDEKTGFTVNPKDYTTYAEKVLDLLENNEFAKQMGKASRKRVVERFSTEVVVKENIRFYESVVSQ
jgi:glycosyltransferase involved in cell wall biosynthesis